MNFDTSLPGYEAVGDKLNQSFLSSQQLRAHQETKQHLDKHAQDQQRFVKKTPLEACMKHKELRPRETPGDEEQSVSEESPRLVALPLRLRGMPTASESWGKDTMQLLRIEDESRLAITDRADKLTNEVLTGATRKLAAEFDKSAVPRKGCDFHKERSPLSLLEDSCIPFQFPKASCSFGSGESSQQPPHLTKTDRVSPGYTMREQWLTSNVRQSDQPPLQSAVCSASSEVSKQTLQDSGLAGVRPKSGPLHRQQSGIYAADPSIFPFTALNQESVMDPQNSIDVYTPTPTRMEPQEVNVTDCQAGGNHNIQSYDKHLMQLEQQNKKRLIKARQEQDAIGTKCNGEVGMGAPFILQQHHQQVPPQQQPNSVQHNTPPRCQQTDPQRQPRPVRLSVKEQSRWYHERAQQHFQILLTSAAQKYEGNLAAVPPSVRLGCLQRAKELAEERMSTDFIRRSGPYAQDPEQINQGLPSHSTWTKPRSKPIAKVRIDISESSKIGESNCTKDQRHKFYQCHKVVVGPGESAVNAYKCMAVKAFDQDRERRKKKHLKLFSSLEPGFRIAQDQTLKSIEALIRYVRYPGFCDAVNRLRDHQRRIFDEALAREGQEKTGEGLEAGGLKEGKMDHNEKASDQGEQRKFLDSMLLLSFLRAVPQCETPFNSPTGEKLLE